MHPFKNNYKSISSRKQYSWVGVKINPSLNNEQKYVGGWSQNVNLGVQNWIEIGWAKNIIQRLENITYIPTFVYQITALFLLTAGLLLAFQNFNTKSTADNVVIQAKTDIAKAEERRIWANASSIDFTNNKLDYKFTVVSPNNSNSLEENPSVTNPTTSTTQTTSQTKETKKSVQSPIHKTKK